MSVLIAELVSRILHEGAVQSGTVASSTGSGPRGHALDGLGSGPLDAAVVAAQYLAVRAVEFLDEELGGMRACCGARGQAAARSTRPPCRSPPRRLAPRQRRAPRDSPTARNARPPCSAVAKRLAPRDALALEIDRRIRRQAQRPRQRVVVLAVQQREFERGRDQHDPARRDAAGLLQRAGDGRGAEAAIALAGEEHRRGHARRRR